MRNKWTCVKVKPQRRWLDVTVEVDYGSTKRWVVVKVPWRMMNAQYEGIANAMASEAQEEANRDPADIPLPLEKWE